MTTHRRHKPGAVGIVFETQEKRIVKAAVASKYRPRLPQNGRRFFKHDFGFMWFQKYFLALPAICTRQRAYMSKEGKLRNS
jgi:hypothetical protein